jgi:hypothetical protein
LFFVVCGNPGDKGRGTGVKEGYSEELEQSIDLSTHHPYGHFWSLIVFAASEHHHPGVNGRDECKISYDWGAVCGRKGRRKDIRDEEYGNTSRHPCGDHTASHQSTTPLNFSSFGERSQKSVYVYCENSEDLSVNLIETHPISRGFRLELSSNNTVLLSRCHMSLWTALY